MNSHHVSTQRRRRRLAVVTSTVPITLDKFHRELVRQVRALGYDVCLVSSPDPLLDALGEAVGARVFPIAMSRQISIRADMVALLVWIRFCLREKPDLVISASPKASLLSQLAGKASGAQRRLYFLSGLRLEGERGPRWLILWMMEWLTSWASTEVVANSSSLRRRYAELGLARNTLLRQTHPGSSHGVDTSHFFPRLPDLALAESIGIHASLPVIGFVGRLTRDKGIDCLISAVALLRADNLPCQLLILGAQDEPDSTAYLTKLRASGEAVAAVGTVDDVRPYFALMTLHVLPSLREGFPNVVLEASAMGVATVTTDATGAVDSVHDGRTGLVVATGDSRMMADAMKRLLVDRELALRYGAAARQWVSSDFNPESVVRTLLGRDSAWGEPEPSVRPRVAHSAEGAGVSAVSNRSRAGNSDTLRHKSP